MSPRRLPVLALAILAPVAVGLGAYLALTWPYAARRSPSPPPRVRHRPTWPYDGKEPVELDIDGVPGLRMYLDPTDKVITPTILMYGRWEGGETTWFVRTVKPGNIIVDAGANQGYYTVIGSKLVGDKGKVYAFEPEPAMFELLEKNVRLNGLTNVVLERKALSDRGGTLKLFLADANKGDHRIYQPSGETRPSVDVEAVRLDEYFRDRGRIDFIKIDTQGAEGLILAGMTGQFEGRSDGPTIFMEFWPNGLKGMGTDAGTLLRTLRSYGYTIYDMRPSGGKSMGPVNPADLLAAHPADANDSQTDLMLLRGGRPLPRD